jgi:hypothetical protein
MLSSTNTLAGSTIEEAVMTTPNGNPSEPIAPSRKGIGAADAATQAAAGEATLIGVNQDVSTSGAADAASSLATQRSNIANQPATSPVTY